MRRHVRTVRRKRLVEILGERDGVGATLPGLACGILGLALAIFAVELGRSLPAHAASPAANVAATSSGSKSSPTPRGAVTAPVGSSASVTSSAPTAGSAPASSAPVGSGGGP